MSIGRPRFSPRSVRRRARRERYAIGGLPRGGGACRESKLGISSAPALRLFQPAPVVPSPLAPRRETLPMSFEKQLHSLLRRHKTLDAVVATRRAHNLSLADAKQYVDAFRQRHFDEVVIREGVSGEIIAFGPWTQDIADCLEYPAERYAALPEGAMVYDSPWDFTAVPGEVLCAALGMTEHTDISQHALDPTMIDLERIAQLESETLGWDLYECHEYLESFRRLRDAGFEFMLRILDWHTVERRWVPKGNVPWE